MPKHAIRAQIAMFRASEILRIMSIDDHDDSVSLMSIVALYGPVGPAEAVSTRRIRGA
jgi:hypothetical protein